MADLNIKKKRKSPTGWIIVGIIALAAIIWALAADFDGEETEDVAYTEQDQAIEDEQYQTNSDLAGGDNVQAFITFTEEGMEVTKHHELTATGLMYLADALRDLATDVNIKSQAEELRQVADQIQRNVGSEQHADMIKDAFETASSIFQQIQQQNYPDLNDEVQTVSEAAQDINPQELATDQSEDIKSFFEQAANVVEQMREA